MVKWLVVGALSFLLVVVALVILGSPEPPASLDEANAEQLEMIETALAAQDEAGRLAEESATALAAQEEAWAKVEAGPQFVLREVAKSADRLDSLGRHTQAQQMRDEAWASFDANPVVQEAESCNRTLARCQFALHRRGPSRHRGPGGSKRLWPLGPIREGQR